MLEGTPISHSMFLPKNRDGKAFGSHRSHPSISQRNAVPSAAAQPNNLWLATCIRFLFRCPHCGEPVEVARKSDKAACEQLDAQPFSLVCLSCRKLFGAPGWRAESHSVTELR